MRAMTLTGELVRLGAAFDAEGLPWLALKGPAFAQLLLGKPMRRYSVDLDLLVPQECEAAAGKLLANRGYIGGGRGPIDFHGVFFNSARALSIELHVRLVENDRQFPMTMFRPFERATMVTIGTAPIPTLAMEPALVFAAVHGAKHFWRQARWVLDFADAVRSDRVDWDAALALARSMGVERQLVGALFLAHDWFGAPVPSAFGSDPRLERAGTTTTTLLRRVTAHPPVVTDEDAYYAIGRWSTLRWRLSHFTRTEARSAVIASVIAPGPKDEAALPLPRALSFLRFFLRPFRLLIDGAVGRRERPRRPPASAGSRPIRRTLVE